MKTRSINHTLIIIYAVFCSFYCPAQQLQFNDKDIIRYYDLLDLKALITDSIKKHANETYKAVLEARLNKTLSLLAKADTPYTNATTYAKNLTSTLTGAYTFKFNSLQYDVVIVNPQKERIQMHWMSPSDKRPYKSLKSIKTYLEQQGDTVIMLTNGGMYLHNNIPQGLFIEHGLELRPLELDSNQYGNFYMKPNGVFYLTPNAASLKTTEAFLDHYDKSKNTYQYATQSGPMLVINGNIHPKFKHHSQNLNLRSGVGILDNGNLVFVISRAAQSNFHDFAVIYKDLFGCKNALYLDGAISRMYVKGLRENDLGGDFGAIISLSKVKKR